MWEDFKLVRKKNINKYFDNEHKFWKTNISTGIKFEFLIQNIILKDICQIYCSLSMFDINIFKDKFGIEFSGYPIHNHTEVINVNTGCKIYKLKATIQKKIVANTSNFYDVMI